MGASRAAPHPAPEPRACAQRGAPTADRPLSTAAAASPHGSSPHLTSHPAAPQSPAAHGPGSLNPHPAAAAGGRPGGSTRRRPSPAQPEQARLGEKGGRRPRAAPTLRAAPPPPLPSFTPAARPLAGGCGAEGGAGPAVSAQPWGARTGGLEEGEPRPGSTCRAARSTPCPAARSTRSLPGHGGVAALPRGLSREMVPAIKAVGASSSCYPK